MPLGNVYEKLENIAKLSGKNDKIALIKGYMGNTPFYNVVQMMFSETLSFNIKELPEPSSAERTVIGDDIYRRLIKLSEQNGVTYQDKQELSNMIGNGRTREVVLRIVTGKSKAGFTASSVNKAVPGSIFTTPYQRCSTEAKIKNVDLPGIIQIKKDGMFLYQSQAFPSTAVTRKGKPVGLFGTFDKELDVYIKRLRGEIVDPVFMGEITIFEKNGDIMPRKKSNGIVNKIIKGKGSKEDILDAVYTVWDLVSYAEFQAKKSDRPYGERWALLEEAINTAPTDDEAAIFMENTFTCGKTFRIETVHSVEAGTLDYARAFYSRARKAKEEGAILKDKKSLWKNNTASDMVKLKHFVEAEFKVVGVNEGEGKYEGVMGSLNVESSDGLVQSAVGSGFTDKERDLNYWKDNIGAIVEVRFESLISDKKRKGVMSLFIPTFVEERFEKTEADDLKYLEELCQ